MTHKQMHDWLTTAIGPHGVLNVKILAFVALSLAILTTHLLLFIHVFDALIPGHTFGIQVGAWLLLGPLRTVSRRAKRQTQ